MSLAEALDFSVIACDIYFSSDLWKQKLKEAELYAEMRMQMSAEITAISQKLSVLIKRPPVVIQK